MRSRENVYKNRAETPYFNFIYQSLASIDAQLLLENQQHLTVSFLEKLINIRPENVFTIGWCTLFLSKIPTKQSFLNEYISKVHAMIPILYSQLFCITV